MALLPCVFGQHRFRGKSGMVYIGLLTRPEATRWKIRVCEQHAQFIKDGLEPHEVSEDLLKNQGPSLSTSCPSCLQVIDSESEPLYVTAYYPGEERRDYYAAVHVNCGAPAWLPYTDPTQLLP